MSNTNLSGDRFRFRKGIKKVKPALLENSTDQSCNSVLEKNEIGSERIAYSIENPWVERNVLKDELRGIKLLLI